MDRQQAKKLLEKYIAGRCSDVEKAIVESWYLQTDFADDLPSHGEIEAARKLTAKALPSKRLSKRLWPRTAAAASIAIAVSAALYFGHPNRPKLKTASLDELRNTMPVRDGVYLNTRNGPTVNLSTAKYRTIRFPDGSGARASAENLDYTLKNETSTVHTLTNNSAERFTVTLNDGTRASLDIGSSISYPTAFSGTSREVNVTGQTYFEVAHDSKRPFRVRTRETVIEDIGTAFNIDAYGPEVLTTLVEGAASVRAAHIKTILRQGEQARSTSAGIEKLNADLESVTDWLQNDITFNHELLNSILFRVGRIYNVSFIWQEDSLKELRFNGSVSRKKKLANVLDYIRKTGPVDFVAIEGKIKVVRKK
ncbi:FecR family protein [Mucilaginibacter pineti]|uniref:FecR family protein n=2 Tax=Mucilaginibacter pineti TaxID=1391627 RepID=A0A1G7IJ43_9SPHI|nr:FecR family protein [Mucilaginibacter pineti]